MSYAEENSGSEDGRIKPCVDGLYIATSVLVKLSQSALSTVMD